MTLTGIILKLHEIGAVKFGSFTLKSQLISPIFIDLRLCISYPKLLAAIADQMYKTAKGLEFDLICGVPYTALPIATAISLRQDVPMIMRRKELDSGIKKPLEGSFERGQRCLIIEDIISSGSSILDTIDSLESEGLKVTDAVVLIDREQGGEEKLAEKGYELHRVFTLTFLLNTLHKEKILDPLTYHSILDFLNKNKSHA